MNQKKINMQTSIAHVKSYLLDLQKRICHALELEDEKEKFLKDHWQHNEGGGGITCVLQEGQVIEKAGVNFSHVHGKSLPPAATLKRPELADCPFQALGVSVVIHPLNPYIPTSHANLRFIVVEKKDGSAHWWFGGGFDLTPYYGFEEDCIHWHNMAKQACLPFGEEVYPRFKKWCDKYFYIKHRNEPRGVGGLFFDDLNEWGFEDSYKFIQSIGEHFIKAYLPIVKKRKILSFGDCERNFQLYRRGRYVEFNLVYDRGTLFGLQSNGRIESILVSLPSIVHWKYNMQSLPGTPEDDLCKKFLIVRDWV